MAALKDGRVWAFAGPSTAAAQAVLLGAGEVLANVSDGSAAAEASAAFPVVLAARRERVQGGDPLLGAIVGACARAGAALCARDGGALALRALPERDPVALRRAWALDVPQGETTTPPRRPSSARTAGCPQRRWGATCSWLRALGRR